MKGAKRFGGGGRGIILTYTAQFQQPVHTPARGTDRSKLASTDYLERCSV